MCRRLPVPNEEEMTWMRAGQPLVSLIAEAYEKLRFAESQAEAEKAQPKAAPEEPKDAVEAMNNAMDDLEALFGFGDVAEKEEVAPEPEEEEFEPLTAEDTKFNPLMYHFQDQDFLIAGTQNHVIRFCPFCGSKLADMG